MPIPEFVAQLRAKVGHEPLWLIGVTSVVLRGDDVLLVRRSDTGAWTPVTGIVDPGEHPADTAVREAAEEACVRVEVESLAWVSVTEPVRYANGDRAQYLDHTFRCRYVGGEPRVGDDESVDVRWWPLHALPPMREEMVERIRRAVEHDGGPTRFDPRSPA